jgi:hypothetical protein
MRKYVLHLENLMRRPPAPIGTRRILGSGYVRIRVDAPNGNQWRLEHRVVWEQAHGPIPKGGIIHHVNHIRSDNRIENLQLIESNSRHAKLHRSLAQFNSRGFTPERRAKLSRTRKAMLTPQERERLSEIGKKGAAIRWHSSVR